MPTTTAVSSEPSRSPRFGPRAALAGWLTLAGLQIALAFSAAAQADDEQGIEPIYRYDLALGGALAYGFVIALTAALALFYAEPRRALGLRRFEKRWIWIAVAVVVLAVAVSAALEPFLHAGEEQGILPETWRPGRAWAFAANAVVIVTIGPFAEELFFRGLGVRVLGVLGGTGAILTTSVVFGLAHDLLVALPPLFLFALALAWVRLRSDSVWPGFLAHAAYNGVGILAALISALDADAALQSVRLPSSTARRLSFPPDAQ